ncbi:hypothetical protein BUALT_Bualt07G0003900 [Buddleja alternifolia]|uniref:RING-type E3 ubiquitin transferase n=1 Tax=Buddleja alternifolia TaxID=168488 RepID=A0AAV6XHR9_9LAMI|nr:hypothetical protein BUALT_Bualt07G0003900 [Buddleja alternifolia]
MAACFFPKNFSFSQKLGIFHKLGLLKRCIAVKDSSLLCNMYSRVSAVPLLDDSDYSTSNSENEGNILRENVREIKHIELFSAVVRVIKSLNWKVVRKVCFSRAVEKYGFDESIIAFRMFVYVYACAEMQMEVYAVIREIVCYYQKAELDLFDLLYTLLNGPNDVERSTFVVNILIKVFASNMLLENAVDAFAQAKRFGIRPSIRSCNFLLKCLAEANEREFVVTLFEEMKNYGPLPSVYTYTIMMNFYCNGHKVDIEQATNVLEEMEKIGISPSVVTYSTYILGLCRVGVIELAWDFIQDLRRNGLPLNCYCYNAIIHEFVNRGEPDKALQLFNEMKNCGIAPDVYSYSILIDGFCRFGNVEKGLSLFEEMEKSNIRPSIVTYSSILKGLCRSGLMETSLDLFQKVGSSGYEYDQHAYNILITGFCVQGDMDSANRLLEEMINNNLAPDSASFKSLIVGFCKIGSFEKAFKFFDIMTASGVLPDLATCNHVISGYCNDGRVQEALQLIDEIREQGISPNMFTYSGVINRLCKEHKPEKALELIPVMLKCNTFPNVVIYSTLIDGFAKQANPRKAFMLYTKMLKVGIFPDSVTFTILINVFSTMGRLNEAYNLFEEMISKGFEPDKISYTSMIAGFCRSQDMKKAWELFLEMIQRGILPSVVTYTCLIDGFCKTNRVDMAGMLVNEMCQKNICPDLVTYYVLIRGYQKLGYVDIAQQLYNEMKNNGISSPWNAQSVKQLSIWLQLSDQAAVGFGVGLGLVQRNRLCRRRWGMRKAEKKVANVRGVFVGTRASLTTNPMSSGGISGGGGGAAAAAAAPQQYFCYQCERDVTIVPPSSPTAELVCPDCQGGFLEEADSAPPANPNINPTSLFTDNFPSAAPFGGFPIIFSSAPGGAPGGAAFSVSSGGGGGGFDDLSSLFGSRSPNEFNPFAFLNNYVNNLQARGANIQLVFETPGGGGMSAGGLPTNLGDYFIGPGLEQLIQQLAENDPNRYGTPPASKSAVEGLPDIKITEEMLASDSSQCAVCKDSFELNEDAKQIPCKHIYHKDCILPWLELHNSCPVCRYELPTDDPDYENRRTGQVNENSSRTSDNSNLGLGAVAGNQESRDNNNTPMTPRTVERRFRISLPWLFGGSGSPAETSNSGGGGAGNNDGGNNNTNNSNSGTDSGRGGQAREEDLD